MGKRQGRFMHDMEMKKDISAAAVALLVISAASVTESRPCGTWFAGNFNLNGCNFDPMRLQTCVRGKFYKRLHVQKSFYTSCAAQYTRRQLNVNSMTLFLLTPRDV